MIELAYDLHTVHNKNLQSKNNVYQQHSNNIHQIYNRKSNGTTSLKALLVAHINL
jgi:hypothetical protein